MSAIDHPYDPVADVWASTHVAYAAIRQRIAAGGPPWRFQQQSRENIP